MHSCIIDKNIPNVPKLNICIILILGLSYE